MNAAKGELWRLAARTTRTALESGALQPIETVTRFVEDGGVRFVVRVVGSLREKDVLRRALTGEGRGDGPVVDPFDPWEESLFVGDLTSTHVALLNKFPVLDQHVLIVTRAFEPQEELLTFADFRALWTCLVQGEALGFYNGGESGGASQPHKHLQLVPLPIADDIPELPIAPLLHPLPEKGVIGEARKLPFQHKLARLGAEHWEDLDQGAEKALEIYRQMMVDLEVVAPPVTETPDARQRRPYNLLVTHDWMLALPRSAEFAKGVSVNAVGFVGGLLVRSEDQLEQVARAGPMSILRETGMASGTTRQ